MLRSARGNTKKDHIKNEDIWRESNIERMTFLRQIRLRWYGHMARKEGGYHQEDGKHATAGKEKKWQQALLISAALKTTLRSRSSNRVGVKQRGSANSDGAKLGHAGLFRLGLGFWLGL